MSKNSQVLAYQSPLKYGKILGINVSSTSKGQVLRIFRANLAKFDRQPRSFQKLFVATPNPEIILEAQRDKGLARILNSASICLPDGVGLIQAYKFLSIPAPKNKIFKVPVCLFQGLRVGLATFFDKQWLFGELKLIKGREMFVELIRLANKKHWRVFLLGGQHNEAEATAKSLQRSYKGVKFSWRQGPIFDKQGRAISTKDSEEEEKTVYAINDFRPHILFVALEPPKQEKWVARWLDRLNIGGAMVVGGTFRYIAGHTPLPPKWMEEAGLEWVWRLITEPRRIRRILNAWPIFPIKVFLNKIRS